MTCRMKSTLSISTAEYLTISSLNTLFTGLKWEKQWEKGEVTHGHHPILKGHFTDFITKYKCIGLWPVRTVVAHWSLSDLNLSFVCPTFLWKSNIIRQRLSRPKNSLFKYLPNHEVQSQPSPSVSVSTISTPFLTVCYGDGAEHAFVWLLLPPGVLRRSLPETLKKRTPDLVSDL